MNEPTLPEQLTSKIEDCDGHWIWAGTRTSHGYGRVTYQGRPELVHRLVYRLLVGPLTDGLELDHLCRIPPCVNPAHLEQVTHRENVLRSSSPAALAAARTSCAAGHEYVEGAFIVRRGARECLECRRAGMRRRYRPKPAPDFTGERNPAAVLTIEQVRQIKSTAYFRGITDRLAAQYGVSRSTISHIRTGRKWADA